LQLLREQCRRIPAAVLIAALVWDISLDPDDTWLPQEAIQGFKCRIVLAVFRVEDLETQVEVLVDREAAQVEPEAV